MKSHFFCWEILIYMDGMKLVRKEEFEHVNFDTGNRICSGYLSRLTTIYPPIQQTFSHIEVRIFRRVEE